MIEWLTMLKACFMSLKEKLVTNQIFYDEISKKYSEFLELKDDLEKHIQAKEPSLPDKIYLSNQMVDNQSYERVWCREKRNKIIECYDMIDKFSKLCHEYNSLCDKLEKAGEDHSSRISWEGLKKWKKTTSSTFEAINYGVDACEKKLKEMQKQLGETLKVLGDYLN
jgi:glutamate mutase epsilon subunit